MKTVQDKVTLGTMPLPCMPVISHSSERSAPAVMHDGARVPGLQSSAIARATREAGATLYELLGMAELMRVAYEKGELVSAQNRLEIIVREAAALSTAFSTILEFIRLESEPADKNSRCFDLVALLQEVSHAARILVQGKPVNVLNAACATHFFITADSDKIRRIITGLVSNAAKFTDRGRIAIILSKDNDEIRLTVADTGKGMTQEQINFVLDSSEFGYDVKINNFASSGLGLRIIKALVKQLHGSLSIASKKCEGTIVAVSLPLNGLQ